MRLRRAFIFKDLLAQLQARRTIQNRVGDACGDIMDASKVLSCT